MTPPTESYVIDKMNVLIASCSCNGESYHHSEMENVRHYERVALEANNQLQELGLRPKSGASADSARADRLRELEIMFNIQHNEIETLRGEKENAAQAAQTRAAALAAAHPGSSSSGEETSFHELSSGEKGASYDIGVPSAQATTCYEAGGHGGNENPVSEDRFLSQVDSESRDPKSTISRSLSPVTPERPSATEQSGPKDVALAAVQNTTAPTVTVHGKGSKPSSSCQYADKKGGSGKGRRNDHVRNPRMVEVNNARDMVMAKLPSKPAAQKSMEQCSFFQRGICRFGNKCGDLHGGYDSHLASPTRKQKSKEKPKGKPAAAAVAVSIPRAHSPVPPERSVSDTEKSGPTYYNIGGSTTNYYIGDSDDDDDDSSSTTSEGMQPSRVFRC